MKRKLLLYTSVGLLLLTLFFFLKRSAKSGDQAIISHYLLVQHVEALGKLELVRYNMQDVVEYEKVRDWLPNAKTLLVVHGEAVGCIDLAKVRAEDIQVIKDSLSIVLPYPELCYCKVDHQRSRVYQVEYGLWETADLVDEAYRYAENHFYTQLKKTRIDAEVKVNAEKLLAPIFQAMGFRSVNIRYQLSTQEPAGR